MNTTILTIIVIYMSVLIGVALYISKKKVKNSDDYMLAGRSLGPFMMAGTLAAAEIGGGSTIGVAQKAFDDWGFSAGWYVVCAGLGILLVSFVAPMLRRALATTVPEIIGRKYGKPAHIVSSGLSILASFLLTAVQIVATASVISAVTGLGMMSAIILSAGVVIVYTVLGGLVSVAMTDIIHIIFITLGMAIVLPTILHNAANGSIFACVKGAVDCTVGATNAVSSNMGGWEWLKSQLPADAFSLTHLGIGKIVGLTIMYFMTFSTGQEAVQRYFAAKDVKSAVWGSVICASIMALYAFVPATIGLVAKATLPGIESKTALASAAMTFAPPIMAGLVLAAICAATMSSASGNMLAASTLITKDVYQRYIKPDATDKQLVLLSRIIIVAVGIISTYIAVTFPQVIPMLVLAFTLRSAGPFAAFVWGLFYKKATKNAGLWSIIIASIGSVVWSKIGEPYGIMSIIFGSLLGTVVFFVISFIEKGDPSKIAKDVHGN